MPLVHRRGGVNCDVFRLGLLPATLSVREKLVDNSRAVTINPTSISAMRIGLRSTSNTYCILSVWSPTCAVPCALVLVARR